MVKKVDIGGKEFTKLLSPLAYSPHKNFVKKLDSKMFPLDQNKVFNYKPEQLAFKEFKRCLELFRKRNPGIKPDQAFLRIAGVQNLIIKAEAPVKKQIEELAISLIRDIYNVPSYVDMKAFINPRLSFDTEQDKKPDSFLELTLEQKNKMREEIKKRECLNSICHGSSLFIWGGVFHLLSEEINKLNPSLLELYNLYTSTIGMTIWLLNPDMMQDSIENNSQITQGFNQLRFNRQQGFGGQIQANAINFPVLLHELNKGVIDWLISAGIPKEYNEAELTYYYSKADSYENELFHYILGPSLWAGLLEASQVSNENLPKLIRKLTQMSYQELVAFFNLMQDDMNKAKEKVKLWQL